MRPSKINRQVLGQGRFGLQTLAGGKILTHFTKAVLGFDARQKNLAESLAAMYALAEILSKTRNDGVF